MEQKIAIFSETTILIVDYIMTKSEKQKLIATNAAIWAAATLISFVLPLIAESMTDGRGNFLKMMAQVFPLICAMWISTGLLSKGSANQPNENFSSSLLSSGIVQRFNDVAVIQLFSKTTVH